MIAIRLRKEKYLELLARAEMEKQDSEVKREGGRGRGGAGARTESWPGDLLRHVVRQITPATLTTQAT